MSVPITEEWFSTSIRRNRKSFIFSSIFVVAILYGSILLPIYFSLPTNARIFIGAAFGLPATFCYWMLIGQRLRDMNLSGWLALLSIPINILDQMLYGTLSMTALILLATVPGSQGANRYGDDPLESGNYYSAL